jgi:SAM-dependent methyltransferase
VRRACFKSGIADEVYSFCVLEHMDDPCELLDEVVRLLKPEGQAILRVPNLGTYSAHLDMTHRFLADLSLWKMIFKGYFEEVEVIPVGTKYRDNRLLVAINALLVRGFGFKELAQGWTFVCSKKRLQPIRTYTGWWQEQH